MTTAAKARFAQMTERLKAKAEAAALARVEARLAARRREGEHWRSAPYLWPLFAS